MPKEKPAPVTAEPSKRTYVIVGLQETDTMPIQFDGRSFDLASLSAEDAAYLLGFPEQVPYLTAIQD